MLQDKCYSENTFFSEVCSQIKDFHLVILSVTQIKVALCSKIGYEIFETNSIFHLK